MPYFKANMLSIFYGIRRAALDPAGELTALPSPDLIAGFKRPYF